MGLQLKKHFSSAVHTVAKFNLQEIPIVRKFFFSHINVVTLCIVYVLNHSKFSWRKFNFQFLHSLNDIGNNSITPKSILCSNSLRLNRYVCDAISMENLTPPWHFHMRHISHIQFDFIFIIFGTFFYFPLQAEFSSPCSCNLVLIFYSMLSCDVKEFILRLLWKYFDIEYLWKVLLREWIISIKFYREGYWINK